MNIEEIMLRVRINIQNLRLKQLMKSNVITGKSTLVKACWYAPWEHHGKCPYWHGVYFVDYANEYVYLNINFTQKTLGAHWQTLYM